MKLHRAGTLTIASFGQTRQEPGWRDTPNPRHNTPSLRPWTDVARMYTQETGEPMSRANAHLIGSRAIEKLRGLLEDFNPAA